MRIAPLTPERLADAVLPNTPFALVGRAVVRLEGGRWSFGEELLPEPGEKTYPPDPEQEDLAAYIGREDRAFFLALGDEGECIGRMRLRAYWNRTAFLESIEVFPPHRGRGVGSALVRRAERWAAERGLPRLMLETQAENLLACRFYRKCGFALGGADTLLYRGFGNPETALFWYKEIGRA